MKYIIKKIFKGIVFIIFAGALGLGLIAAFMFVSTGEVDVDRMKEELYSDYKDMDFNRPKKETYFSLAMKKSVPTTGVTEDTPMSEEYKAVYDKHLKVMEKDLIYLESGDGKILDDKEVLPILTKELTDSIKNVDSHVSKYNDDVLPMTLNGRDTLEHRKIQVSNKLYIESLNDLSIAIEDENKEGFESSIRKMETAGNVLVEGIPEDGSLDEYVE